MKTIILLAGLLCGLNAIAQTNPCATNRYTNIPIFDTSQFDRDTGRVYARAKNWLGQFENLTMNVYGPQRSLDPLQRRPLIMLVHGGGFVGGDKNQLIEDCLQLARRGFVTATINYRLGRNCATDSLSKDKAVYRALQDAHAAMRFLVANRNNYGIDTSKIFVGGGSAGAATVLNLVYATQDEANTFLPQVVAALGLIDTSGNTLRNRFSIKGIWNNWGALAAEYFYDAAEAKPMISFHGSADKTVPIGISTDQDCRVNGPVSYGSGALHPLLTRDGICNNLSVKIGGDHGVYNTSRQATLFRINKVACFFKSLFCGGCQTITTTDSIPANCAPGVASIPADNGPVSTGARLSPNPAAAQVWLNGVNPAQVTSILVYDQFGRLQTTLPGGSSTVNVQRLLPGNYFLVLNMTNAPAQKLRLVKL